MLGKAKKIFSPTAEDRLLARQNAARNQLQMTCKFACSKKSPYSRGFRPCWPGAMSVRVFRRRAAPFSFPVFNALPS